MSDYLDIIFNLPVQKQFTYSIPEKIRGEFPDLTGFRAMAPFGRRSLLGYIVGHTEQKPDGVEIKEITRLIGKKAVFHQPQLDLARWLAEMYLCSLGEALAAMLPGGRRESKSEDLLPREVQLQSFDLAEQQIRAIDRITARSTGTFYLYGVTGSGKTEVFLRVTQKLIQQGRSVIYLVPEIALTYQVVELFSTVFQDRLAVLHSGLTPSQRLKEWQRVQEGEATLVIGARSAVFAPVRNLGLIVVDEEHEGSYKSGSTPRYHARQVAMHRCKKEGAILLMGSATPSVEAYYYMQTGLIQKLVLPERLSGGALPAVEIQDLKKERGPLSRGLISEIRHAHSEGRQTILFLNRRGFAYSFSCRSCGYTMQCRNCSVSMTYHKTRDQLICHYCGFRTPPQAKCPECGSLDVGYSGFGTQRIEEEVSRLFPDLSVHRIDTDSVRKKHELRKILQDFHDGTIHILLGTQMVAKGLNFPGVKLVGIISADMGLQLPDFRAAERTFNLIVQVSGRAGRYHPDGKVIIQTHVPDNETIRLAAAGDLETFYENELVTRDALGFPPFARLIRLLFRSRSSAKARNAAQSFLNTIRSQTGESEDGIYQALGPAECPISVIAGNHRQHIIFKTRQFTAFHRLLRGILADYIAPAGVYLEIDVDPVALL